MDIIRVLFGRTAEGKETEIRPANLLIRAGGFEFRTVWPDWKATSGGASEIRGFQPIDPDTGSWIFSDDLDPAYQRAGLRITPVAIS